MRAASLHLLLLCGRAAARTWSDVLPDTAYNDVLPDTTYNVPGAQPFPSGVDRMYPGQKEAVAAAQSSAQALSAAATPLLLAHINASSFRQGLQRCCSKSGLATESASTLLMRLREVMYAAELVHNFDGSFETDATIPIGAHNATDYFPSTWQLRWLGYYGPRGNPRWGFPHSCEGVSEESIFRLPPYHGPHDEPMSYAAASSRLYYIALNMLRVDVGNPDFGNVTAVFSPRFWADAVVAAPADSGLYTMFCNETYRKIPGAHLPPFDPLITCKDADDASAKLLDITAGVAGAMDHVLYYNLRFWARYGDMALRALERSFGDGGNGQQQHNGQQQQHNVSEAELKTYIEPNILANALYRDGAASAVKMLVGSFVPLFGTARGQTLREWAHRQQIVLTWAMGAGTIDHRDALLTRSNRSFAGSVRILDVPTSGPLVNMSSSAADASSFEEWWHAVADARGAKGGALPPARVWELWEQHRQMVPAAAQLALPRAGECADWAACLGRGWGGDGECVCLQSSEDWTR